MSKASGYGKGSTRASPSKSSYRPSSINIGSSTHSYSASKSPRSNPNSYNHSSPRLDRYSTSRSYSPRREMLYKIDPDPKSLELEEYDIEGLLKRLAKKSKK
ncbi:MAG: hypothetical protein QGF74_02945 [Candidatus Nanoarchaeia archaeon]|jgi:hypothetical protein|nr:hypothetical protein [Candidatus Nanoarchaeia archaeon]|tara:strand:- start:2764 stop:3069 length:306 start_codon:yes stop_codon:yes gene_type:complete